MKVLVTGGAGYIGSVLVAKLIEKGITVNVLDDLSSGHKNNVHPKANFFKEISEWLEPLYLKKEYKYLSEANIIFIKKICKYLEINTKIENSSNYTQFNGQTENLVNICTQSNATEYVSGPSAKNYINESLFNEKNIKLKWINYDNYKKYDQLWGDFVHNVSIVDLLFNLGSKAKNYI